MIIVFIEIYPILQIIIHLRVVTMRYNKLYLTLALAAILSACHSKSDKNSAPEFSQVAYSFNVTEDTVFNGEVIATDNGQISYSIGSAANNGVLKIANDGKIEYTPNVNFFGEDNAVITASDGSLSTNVNVANVNDAPTLINSTIALTNKAISQGKVEITDIDGDDITIAIVKQPENATVEFKDNGNFTLTSTELELIGNSFIISFTDGNIETPINAEIEIKPSYVTNEDKRNYYYASEKSHIKQAQAIQQTLNDDLSKDKISALVAGSYAQAGYITQATEQFETISTTNERARAYVKAGEALDKVNNTTLANTYRENALGLFNVYMANKGFDNVSTSDADFYLALINDYNNANQIEQATKLSSTVQTFAEEVRKDEYNIAYGKFLVVYWKNAQGMVEIYTNNHSVENLAKAKNAIQDLANLAEKTGYGFVKRSGPFKGSKHDNIKILYLSRAAEMFYSISRTEDAKKYTNMLAALYNITDLDNSYDFTASPNTAANISAYQFGLRSLSGLITGLYPSITDDNNPALKLIVKSSDVSSARETMFSAQIVNAVVDGQSIDDAIAPAFNYFETNNDLKTLFKTLTQDGANKPRSAIILNTKGQKESAQQLLVKASDLLVSQAYIDSQSSSLYLTGNRGCATLTQLTANVGGNTLAQANACRKLMTDHLTSDKGKFTTTKAIGAYFEVLSTLAIANEVKQIKEVAIELTAEINRQSDPKERAEDFIKLAIYLMRYDAPVEAKLALENGFTAFDKVLEDDLNGEKLEKIIKYLDSNVYQTKTLTGGVLARENFITELKKQAGNISDYATYFKGVMTLLTDKANAYTTKALQLDSSQVISNMTALVNFAFYTNQQDKVKTLLANDKLQDGDRLALNTHYAVLLASRDSFPGTSVASVDTDNDGLANFYHLGVTDEQAASSKIQLDNDADNDGIIDSEDPTPLG